MANFFGIGTVEHVDGSPEEHFEPGRSHAVRVYDCPWTSRFTLARFLLGRSRKEFPVDKHITRDLPHAHPEAIVFTTNPPDPLNPTRGYLWATKIVRCEGKGFRSKASGGPLNVGGGGGVNDIAVYEKARLTVEYTTLPYDVLTKEQTIAKNALFGVNLLYPEESTLVRYVTKQTRPTASTFLLPQGFFKRTTTTPPLPVIHGLHKTINSCNFELTWHHIPEDCVPLPLVNPLATVDVISNCLGKVNSVPFAGYAPGKLLLLGAELHPEINAFGYRVYDIKYMMKLFDPTPTAAGNPKGHNHIFLHSPGEGTPQAATSWFWGEVTANGLSNLALVNGVANPTPFLDGQNIFDWADFRPLFRPAL